MEDKIINIDNIEIKELDSLKEKYLDLKMPEEQLEKLKLAILIILSSIFFFLPQLSISFTEIFPVNCCLIFLLLPFLIRHL